MGPMTDQLLRETTPLVGRRNELDSVKRLLESSHLVTLTGIGGAGKTRLARRVTSDLSRVFKDGAWIVELADLHDPGLLGHTISTAVGVQVQSAEWRPELLIGFFGARKVLLTLDNCEHLIEACADLIDELLSECPGVRVIATSQRALGLSSERIFQVPPLSLPDPSVSHSIESLPHYESITLFVDRAAALQPGFELTASNAESVITLCRALDGIPLALELAAARIRVLSPQAMVDRLDDRYRLLSRGFGGRVPDRQRSLEASVLWTYDLCSEQERDLWAKLSVFRGGFSLDAAEAVGFRDELHPMDVMDLVASLVDRSVVVREDNGVHVRYRMLETLRLFGEARLSAAEQDAVRRRHRDFFAELITSCAADWFGPGQVEWLRILREEHANLRVALQFCVGSPAEAPAALRMVSDLEGFWVATGRVSEARRWLDLALAHGTGEVVDRAVAARVAAWFALVQVDHEAAAAKVELARQLAGESDEEMVQAQLLLGEGLFAAWQNDHETGMESIERSLAVLERLGDRTTLTFGLVVVGMLLGFTGSLEQAAVTLRRCVAISEPVDEMYMRSFALAMLGLLALVEDDPERASRLARDSISMKRMLDDELGTALALEFLAWIAVAEKHAERAGVLLGAAERRWKNIGVSLDVLPYFSVLHSANEQVAMSLIPQEQYDAASTKGQSMSGGAAVAYALDEPTARARPTRKREKSVLTAREMEVAGLVTEGLTNQQIADRLVLSTRTAEAHVENILKKLGFSSRTAVASWFAQHEAERD
jgi:predicted ATPase/DNA-binding CsgD family transcriptional regulator